MSYARIVCVAVFTCILVFISIGPAEAQDNAQAANQQIIDVHLHALPLDMLPAHWDTLAGYERPASAERLRRHTIDQLERFNIEKAVTSSDAELLAEYKKAAPDRIIRSRWMIAVPPNVPLR